MVGYTTLFTMAPVFSLVLDQDVPERLVFVYPELYKELQKVGLAHVFMKCSLWRCVQGRVLSMKTFCLWLFKSVYQGGCIMMFAMLLFEDSFINIVAITFTALVLAELLNVGFEV